MAFLSRSKQLFLLICLCFCISDLSAQANKNNIDSSNVKWLAHVAEKGIYIFTWPDLVSAARPVDGITAYRIERRSGKEPSWKWIADVECPATEEDLITNLSRAAELVSDPWSLDAVRPNEIWDRLDRYHRSDSLGWWSGIMAVRLASGFGYLDTSVQTGEKYQYRVSQVRDSAIAGSFVSKEISFPYHPTLERSSAGKVDAYLNRVNIDWWFKNSNELRTCKVYRREGIAPTYQEINTQRHLLIGKDGTRLRITDTTIKPNSQYHYYIVPMDAYGNTAAATDSVMLSTSFFHNHKLPEHLNVEVAPQKDLVHLSWMLRDSENVRTLHLYKSDNWDTGYVQIAELAGTDSEYYDRNASHAKTYYYYLVMEGVDGSFSQPSAKMFALSRTATGPVPPSRPEVMLENDGVRLRWQSNDPDIDGFFVYRGEGFKDAVLTQISPMVLRTDSITTYLDTSADLIPNTSYAYAVVAENNSHARGTLSDTAYFFLQGKRVLRAPYELDVLPEANAAALVWTDMLEHDPSIWGYEVYRREMDRNGEFAKISNDMISRSQNHFEDSTVRDSVRYEYAVLSIDISGNKSGLSNPKAISIVRQSDRLLQPSGLRAQSTDQGIEVRWDTPLDERITGYTIYRREEEGTYSLIYTAKEKESQYLDKSAANNTIYFYQIRSQGAKGASSEPSEEIVIQKK